MKVSGKEGLIKDYQSVINICDKELECVATLLLAILTIFGTFFFITSAVGRFCEKLFLPCGSLQLGFWHSVVNLVYFFFPFYSCNFRFVFIIY